MNISDQGVHVYICIFFYKTRDDVNSFIPAITHLINTEKISGGCKGGSGGSLRGRTPSLPPNLISNGDEIIWSQ